MKKVLLSLAAYTLLFGCDQASSDKDVSSTPTSTPADTIPQKTIKKVAPLSQPQQVYEGKVVINRVFATSTALPQSENTVYNCFDGDLGSSWKTIKGSTEEEGIMIYLDHPVKIYNIGVLNKSGKTINDVIIYADGGNHWEGMDEAVSNIFIKKNDGYKYYGPAKNNYDPNKSFEIAEIVFYKKDDSTFDIITPHRVAGKASATSSLTPEVAYGPNNLIDKQSENAWAENIEGNGIGETFTISLDEAIDVDEIRIWNGYQRSKEHASANASAKKITLSAGTASEVLSLDNTYNSQSHRLTSPVSSNVFTFKIDAAYPGKTYQDLVISEVQFLKDGIAYDIASLEEGKRVKENKAIDNKLLQAVLDRNLVHADFKSRDEGDVHYFQSTSISLLLRSNNTFVLYDREVDGFYEETEGMPDENYNKNSEIIGDGSWEIKSLGEDKVVVRIFGKKFEPRDASDMYKGEVENSTLKIFQDFITITPSLVSGKNVVGKIPLNE